MTARAAAPSPQTSAAPRRDGRRRVRLEADDARRPVGEHDAAHVRRGCRARTRAACWRCARPSRCRVALKTETARVGRYSLPLNVRFCFQRRRFSVVSSRYLINCSKQTGLLSISAQ